MVILRLCHTNVKGCKEREHVSLNPRHQNLDQIDKQHNQRRCDAYKVTLKDKGERNKAQYHNVTRGNRHKQTNHQRDRLSEDSNDLHRKNNDPQWQRHARCPENVRPVRLVSAYVRDDEREYGQRHGNSNIPCKVGGTWK